MAEPCCSRGRFQMGDAVVRAGEDGRKGKSNTLPAKDSWHVPQGGGKKGGGCCCRVGDWVASRGSPEQKREPPMAKRKSPGVGIAEEVQPVFEKIAGLVDAFCREHLNEEYAVLCCRLAEKLARKRPSPMVSGKPTTWACGIVRTIGWVNFLGDRSQKPHMKLTAIDKAF